MDTSNHLDTSMISTEILPADTAAAFEVFSKVDWLSVDWYLAGGTAFALQAKHRESVDLDFFHPDDFNVPITEKQLEGLSGWKTTFTRKGTIYGELLGAKASFIVYPFFKPKQDFLKYGTVSVLQLRDIGVMKIVAISQRGRKRDFVDLYWYVKNKEPLINLVKLLPEQYPSVAHDYHHILKSLTYFDGAENEPMPVLHFSATWEEMKKFFLEETKKVSEEVLRLGE
jgi:hypothetical protein